MNNAGAIFRRTLYDHRRSILWWSIGIGVLAFYVTIVFPMIAQFEQFNELLESPLFGALFGDLGELDYTSPEGFLGIEFFTWAPLVLAVFAVMFGLGIVGGEEDRGTLDLLLSTPIPRWRIIIEKTVAFLVALVIILALSALAMIAAVAMTPELAEMNLSMIVVAMINVIPTVLLMMTLALCLSTVMRSRGQAGGVAAGIIVASYFINSFADMAESGLLKTLQNFSFYKYYAPFRVLLDGVQWGNFLLLLVVSLALLGLALYFFQRRDLAV
ncbi:MAG: ABC transporter permease subunit [Anaerolineae bacterium]|nr:ABC transporter permease subunit [Anaerolineae bacterium]